MVGTTISHYKITEKIGQGGMGEVYRATDTKLNRDVALKVLPEAYTSDQQRMARFAREAQVLASLNHPNIASIYGLEESDGKQALVLELVEGETLAQRIKKGAIPLEESLKIALQITEALEAAHEKGVIHRDLKPANVKITPEGAVKVLDFGLAKALEGEAPSEDIHDSPTISQLATKAGIILGTAAYMSPEQARGKTVDRRTDIWAFGVVLYEMLTGKQTFEGEDISLTLAAVMKEDPNWDALPSKLPAPIDGLLRRCLDRDHNERLRDIGEARISVGKYLADPSAYEVDVTATPQPSERRLMVPWGVAGMTTVALLIALVTLWLTPATEQALMRLHVHLPADQSLHTQDAAGAVLSPDGKRLAYVTGSGQNTQLYLRTLDQLEATPLSGTEGALTPFFSPDGQWVGFTAQGSLKKISVSGGAALTLCALNGNMGASWGPDDTIIFTGGNRGLSRVPAAGGTPEEITVPDPEKGENSHRFPQFLPDGKSVLFGAGVGSSFQEANIEVLSLETGERKVVHRGGYFARYVPTGHLVFMHEATLFAARFDLDDLELTGSPAPILEGVWANVFGDAQYAFSQTGTLVYLPGSEGGGGLRSLVWVDRDGKEEPLAAEPRPYRQPRVSPDGSRLAMQVAGGTGSTDIWTYDVAHETSTRLTFDAAGDGSPMWTLDGQRVVFRSTRDAGGLFWKAADGTGSVEPLTTSPNLQIPYSFGADGRKLVFQERSSGGWDIHMLSMEGEPSSQVLLQDEWAEFGPAVSPDGQWMAYTSNESGQREVYVRPFPNVQEGKWQISSGGASEPVWGPNGQELFYRSGQEMMVVPIRTQPTFTRGNPQVLFTGIHFSGTGRNYDISPNGQRFLMMKNAGQAGEASAPTQLIIVLNWLEELKRLMPTGE